MALILNIETSTTICSVSLAENERNIFLKENDRENSHSEVLTVFIEELYREAGIQMNETDAIAVSMGPGSYTGLRIGVSTAKGLCYSLDKPLIAVPTLQSLALGGAAGMIKDQKNDKLFCPMIDARRMEVYTAIYDDENNEVRGVEAQIITAESFSEWLKKYHLVFFGNGASKCKEVLPPGDKITYIDDVALSAEYMAVLSYDRFNDQNFEDLAYFEPLYLKEFIAGKPRVKGLT